MNIVEKIIDWAEDRGILVPENLLKQLSKTAEEVGETMGAYVKEKGNEMRDGIGDINVTLIIACEQINESKNYFRALKQDIEAPTKEPLVYLHLINKKVAEVVEDIVNGAVYFCGLKLFECVVLLRQFCAATGQDLDACTALAYNEIKDRTGKSKNGVFIKDEE